MGGIMHKEFEEVKQRLEEHKKKNEIKHYGYFDWHNFIKPVS